MQRQVSGLPHWLAKHGHWLLFVVLEAVAVGMLVRFNRYQGSVWFTSAGAVTGRVLEWQSDLRSYVGLQERNRALTQRNVVLEQRVALLREQIGRLTCDTTYTLQRQEELLEGFSLVEAEVVSATVSRHDNYLTINKGSADGVKPEMGVVCGTGVVGIVYQTSAHYAIVMPLLNSKCNISCRLRGTGYHGSLGWQGGHPLLAFMGDVPRHARVKAGMTVETSGFSAVFPAGLFVGRVRKVENSDDGLSYRLQVNLGTDFARLHDVCVILSAHHAEIDSLQRQAVMVE